MKEPKTSQITFNSHLESQFAMLWDYHYPSIDLVHDAQVPEVSKFGIKYRYDFLQFQSKVAIEIQGGVWMPKGGHNTANGLQRDYEKCNLIQLCGWDTFLISEDMMTDEWIHRIANHMKTRSIV